MKWWRKLEKIDRSEIPLSEAGHVFDKYTYKGNVKHLIVLILLFLFLFYFSEIIMFGCDFVGRPCMANEADLRWRRTVAFIIFIPAILIIVLSIAYLPFRRRNALKSSKGQWYDSPDIKKEDLYDNERKGE